ncbi:MAG: glycerate kinase [Clostridia bacterium]|nr:glycerate kinase [Clostridia bacterium]
MKVTVAIDSFKGSLSTFQAGSAIAEGIKKAYEDAQVQICPIADGGEGTVEAVISATGGEMVDVTVHNPIGELIKSSYGIITETKTAVIEMSAASGITLISDKDRNPLHTTTYGVGEMIKDAILRGCRKFIIGIGGSATNDGGIGMLQALGFEFLNKNEEQVSFGAKGLCDIAQIRIDNAMDELKECKFLVACDVKNTLCGENGCSAVFGPQKGATPEMIKDMDMWLKGYAEMTKKVIPKADEDITGTGAAGGLGYALLSYLNAELKSGIGLVMKETDLEKYIKDSDIVVTGEGRLDGQSYMGKAPVGVANLAKKYSKPVVAFSGCVTDDAVICNEHGIDAFFPILRTPCMLDEAMNTQNAYKNLSDTAQQVFRLIKLFD